MTRAANDQNIFFYFSLAASATPPPSEETAVLVPPGPDAIVIGGGSGNFILLKMVYLSKKTFQIYYLKIKLPVKRNYFPIIFVRGGGCADPVRSNEILRIEIK